MMGNTKLMTPLFYQGNYNADGKKMRALFLREVSNGTETYRLWRRDGKPDREYPQGEEDAYILYVEQGGYLAPLHMRPGGAGGAGPGRTDDSGVRQ